MNLVLEHGGRVLEELIPVAEGSPQMVRNAVRRVLAGVSRLRSTGLARGDVKPQNILAKEASSGILLVQLADVGEAVEAVRKPGPDSHCPEFTNFLIEEADVLIRVGDTCLKRELPLGEATVAKLLYNLSRPFKHGKNS